jgi:hypothetical protein
MAGYRHRKRIGVARGVARGQRALYGMLASLPRQHDRALYLGQHPAVPSEPIKPSGARVLGADEPRASLAPLTF